MLNLKAALCAALSLCAASPAAAVTVVTYRFSGLATGSYYNTSMTLPTTITGRVTFLYAAPAGNPGFGNYAENGNFASFNYVSGGLAGGNTTITEAPDGLRFAEMGYTYPGAVLSTYSASACFDNATGGAAGLPTATPQLIAGCGSLRYSYQGKNIYYDLTGQVDEFAIVSVQEGGARPIFGAVFAALDVPEPSTWLMMLVGFGLSGLSLRRRPRRTGCSAAY